VKRKTPALSVRRPKKREKSLTRNKSENAGAMSDEMELLLLKRRRMRKVWERERDLLPASDVSSSFFFYRPKRGYLDIV
jgi:hypothetical protein